MSETRRETREVREVALGPGLIWLEYEDGSAVFEGADADGGRSLYLHPDEVQALRAALLSAKGEAEDAARWREVMGDLLTAIRWWAAQEDGIPSEVWGAYVEGCGLLGWAVDGTLVQEPGEPEPSTWLADLDAHTPTDGQEVPAVEWRDPDTGLGSSAEAVVRGVLDGWEWDDWTDAEFEELVGSLAHAVKASATAVLRARPATPEPGEPEQTECPACGAELRVHLDRGRIVGVIASSTDEQGKAGGERRLRDIANEMLTLPIHDKDYVERKAVLELALRVLEVADALHVRPTPAVSDEVRERVIDALAPFAAIGAWLYARDLPDDTPVVEIAGLHGTAGCLTRGHFKAAHRALAFLRTPRGEGEAMRVLRALEWSAEVERDGHRYEACPNCGGLNPADTGNESDGHAPTCELVAALRTATPSPDGGAEP